MGAFAERGGDVGSATQKSCGNEAMVFDQRRVADPRKEEEGRKLMWQGGEEWDTVWDGNARHGNTTEGVVDGHARHGRPFVARITLYVSRCAEGS